MTEDRITALEERLTHQDRTIEDLNATIMDLWKEIETIRRHMGRLGDQIEEIAADVPQAPEPPPPHY